MVLELIVGAEAPLIFFERRCKMRRMAFMIMVVLVGGCASTTTRYPSVYESMNADTRKERANYDVMKPMWYQYDYPIRFPEQVISIWIAPQEVKIQPDDRETALITPFRVFIVFKEGRWYIERPDWFIKKK